MTVTTGTRTPATVRVASEVRAWRGRLQISQKTLSERLGLSQASMSARLNGKAAFTLDELDTLAEMFGIEVTDLFGPSTSWYPTAEPATAAAFDLAA